MQLNIFLKVFKNCDCCASASMHPFCSITPSLWTNRTYLYLFPPLSGCVLLPSRSGSCLFFFLSTRTGRRGSLSVQTSKVSFVRFRFHLLHGPVRRQHAPFRTVSVRIRRDLASPRTDPVHVGAGLDGRPNPAQDRSEVHLVLRVRSHRPSSDPPRRAREERSAPDAEHALALRYRRDPGGRGRGSACHRGGRSSGIPPCLRRFDPLHA